MLHLEDSESTFLIEGGLEMSAIWGAVNLTGGEIAKEEIRLLKAAFAKCRIDRYEEICTQHIYMGCGIQTTT